jgi:DNA-binding CsgD family transcriptional regulator
MPFARVDSSGLYLIADHARNNVGNLRATAEVSTGLRRRLFGFTVNSRHSMRYPASEKGRRIVNNFQERDQPLDSRNGVLVSGEFASSAGDCRDLLTEAIEAVRVGIILVARDGRILYANSMARDLMRSGRGLRSSYGRLVATHPEGAARLPVLAKIEAAPTVYSESKSQIIVLSRGEGVQHLFAYIVAVQPDVGGAAIFIVDPEHYAIPNLDAFASRYRLTIGEARVLREIVSGQGLVAAAKSLDIAESTARTHLRRVFGKTGVGRQTELLRLYLAGVPPGAWRTAQSDLRL